jgi:hypothetical protein
MRGMFFAAAVALGLGAVSPISNAAVTVETVSGREFVQFGLSFPRAQNPAFDKNGNDCYAGQHGDTWYLGASFGGTTVRSCEVPEGVALVVTTGCFYCFPPYGPGEWEDCPRFMEQDARTWWVEHSLTIDGMSYSPGYTISGPYKVWYSNNNLSKLFRMGNVGTLPPLKAGVYGPAMDGGYYGKIEGLELGTHVIHGHSVGADGTVFDGTWNITVK